MHHAVPVDFKQSTSHPQNGGWQSICRRKQVSQEELSRDQMSTIIAFNHIRSDSSLILRCKTIFHEAVPMCLGSEVSWVRSVLGPKCLFTGITRQHWQFFLHHLFLVKVTGRVAARPPPVNSPLASAVSALSRYVLATPPYMTVERTRQDTLKNHYKSSGLQTATRDHVPIDQS